MYCAEPVGRDSHLDKILSVLRHGIPGLLCYVLGIVDFGKSTYGYWIEQVG